MSSPPTSADMVPKASGSSNPPVVPTGPSSSSTAVTPRSLSGPNMNNAASARSSQNQQRHRQPKKKNLRSHNTPRVTHHGPDGGLDDELEDLLARSVGPNRRANINITSMVVSHASVHPSFASGSSHGRSSGWRRSQMPRHQPIEQAAFVNANYRFILKPWSSKCAELATVADTRVPWGDVLQVLVSPISQAGTCPMCLYEPTAPRMTKCGHIYCLTCVMQFLATTLDGQKQENRGPARESKKCPICEESIVKTDLRPVRFYAAQETAVPKPGEDVILRLMRRPFDSTLALPWSSEDDDSPAAAKEIPWFFEPYVLDFARVMKGTVEYMEEQYDEEVAAIDNTAARDYHEFGEESEWPSRAISSITEMKKKLSSPEPASQEPVAVFSSVPGAEPRLVAPAATPKATSTTTSHPPFLFFSAPPHLYLSPLDIRILKEHYGTYDAFPSTLLPKVTGLSAGNPVDAELRQKFRYLSHLPIGCTVTFLECNWTGLIPEETLSQFKEQLSRRVKKHTDKERAEEVERRRAEKRGMAELRRTVGVASSGNYDDQGRWNAEPEIYHAHDSFLADVEFPAVGEDNPDADREKEERLSNVATKKGAWGTLYAEPSADEFPSLGGGNDGWLADAELEEAAIARQMAQLELGEEGGTKKSKTAGGAKKKKAKKITLMSTGGNRGS